MAVTQYIGSRYVPLFADPIDWDSTKHYEPLTIVYHQGNSFTSKQFVPTGIDIANGDYWVPTGNYNAQVEQYRREVKNLDNKVTTNTEDITTLKNATVGTDKLDDGAVTNAKLATDAVATGNIADGAVTNAKLANTAESLGIIPNDKNAASQNATIIQNALNNNKIIAFGNARYFVAGDITLTNDTGMYGISSASTFIEFVGKYGIKIVVNEADLIDDVYIRVTLRNMEIHGDYDASVNNDGANGIEVQYNGNIGRFAKELRSCKFNDLKIVCFNNGIAITGNISVAEWEHIYIDTCYNWGIYSPNGSDMHWSDINITYCGGGMCFFGETNIVSNCYIFNLGHNTTTHKAFAEKLQGILVSGSYSFNNYFSNVLVEEFSGSQAWAIINTQNIYFENCGACNNAVNGFEIIGSKNCYGSIASYNRSDTVSGIYTQTGGVYIADNCKEIHLDIALNNISQSPLIGNFAYDVKQKFMSSSTEVTVEESKVTEVTFTFPAFTKYSSGFIGTTVTSGSNALLFVSDSATYIYDSDGYITGVKTYCWSNVAGKYTFYGNLYIS